MEENISETSDLRTMGTRLWMGVLILFRKLQLFLSVFVDDIKMAGQTQNISVLKMIATFRVARLPLQTRKCWRVGGCRDRQSRALPLTCPNCCEWTFHSLRDWAHVGVVLCELPTASSHFGSKGVLWVLTGTHPCGPPSRRMEVTRAPALVDCGAWSWCCCQVVLWSHREVWEYECISTPLHWLPRLPNLVVSLRSLCK